MPDQAPLVQKVRADLDASAAGADASVDVRAPFAGTVSGVSYVPKTALTGADTESRTLTVTNKGQAGSGTTVVASKAFTSGVNAPADDETSLTLSVVANATTVAEGDILEVASTHVGATGLADPGGTVIVEFTRA